MKKSYLLATALVLCVLIYYFISDRETTLVVTDTAVPADKSKKANDASASESQDEYFGPPVSAIDREVAGPTPMFRPASDEVIDRLTLWLNSDYIPYMDLSEYHLRSTFVVVDPISLVENLKASYHANGGFIHPRTNLTPSNVDFVFPLFGDSDVQATLIHFKVGRHSGLITSKFRTAALTNDTEINTDNIYFEVNAEGQVSGIVDTPEGMFRVRPTPETNVLVISEMDSKLVYGALVVE